MPRMTTIIERSFKRIAAPPPLPLIPGETDMGPRRTLTTVGFFICGFAWTGWHAPATIPAAEPAAPTIGDEASCQTLGTAIRWHRDLDQAVRLAKRESKLLFVLHLSGNFTKSAFT